VGYAQQQELPDAEKSESESFDGVKRLAHNLFRVCRIDELWLHRVITLTTQLHDALPSGPDIAHPVGPVAKRQRNHDGVARDSGTRRVM